MLLRHLELHHFRNYARLDAAFAGGLVLLQGPNAQGKTNLLEAIYLLATTKSSRARTDADLISWAERDPLSPQAFARIIGRVERASGEVSVEILIRDTGTEGQARKRFKLNGAERRASEVLGKVNAVFFAPTDVDLVDGPPAGRRRYMDIMLCQVDSTYFRSLQHYNRAVLQRNALLRQIREGQQQVQSLEYWDGALRDHGALIIAARATATAALGQEGARRHHALSDGRESLEVRYRPGLPETVDLMGIVQGGAAVAHDALREALVAVRGREVASGVSLVGPHRDDLAFAVNGIDATAFGSRGQQRTVALSLKLAELAFLRSASGEQPILLLDDATSELDTRRRDAILAAAMENEQTFVTSADPALLDAVSTSAQRWEVRSGTLGPAITLR